MAFTSGTRLGPYEILSALGAGGMGEVYRARDVRLARDVAIKVLHSSVTIDADRRHRFEQEARAAAALNHPNILAVFDIGDNAGAPYIVSELLEGETLRDQLAAGALPVRRALDLAVQIAQGLAAAHDKGIIHRDLKPENVFVTRDGRAKILDFGLAKLKAEDAGQPDVSRMLTTPPTQPGVVFGTVGYMAPEQVRGQTVDARADIFAFGAVLYELLTGARAFQRETAAETMTAILREDPPALQSDASPIPPALRRIVDRCLAKNPSGRFKSADDLAFALGSPSDASGPKPAESPVATVKEVSRDGDEPRRRDRTRRSGQLFYRVLAIVAVIGLLRVVPALIRRLEPRPAVAPSAIQLQIVMPDGVNLLPWQAPAVSPDGSRIALVAVDEASGKRQIYVRSLSSLALQMVPGATRALHPFWSPDGQRLAFFADGRLKTVDIASGTVQDAGLAPSVGGPGWWVDDVILWPASAGPIQRLSLKDSTRRAASPFNTAKEGTQYLAGVLADRRRFVFGSIFLGSRVATEDGGASSIVGVPVARGILDAPWIDDPARVDGHILFIRDTTLFAQGFDGAAARMTSEPRALVQNVTPFPIGISGPVSVRHNVLAYVDASSTSSRLVWVNRHGQEMGPAASLRGVLRDPRLSPDGGLVAVGRWNSTGGAMDLTVINLARDTTSKLTSALGIAQGVWMPDGSAFVAAGTVAQDGVAIYRVPTVEGSKPVQVTHDAASGDFMPDLSRDGRTLVYSRVGGDGTVGLATKPLDTGGEGQPFPTAASYSVSPHLSPDGRWVAYQSNEAGSVEIYVRSFPDGREKQQISSNGGLRPVWRRDGAELFYLTPDGDLVAAAMTTTPTLKVGTRETLFRAPVDPTFALSARQYDVSADGQRFLMVVPATEVRRPVNVILNWQALLSK